VSATLGVPLSRLSTADIVREVQRHGIVATVSNKTVWRLQQRRGSDTA
jgi:hypothetical protein